MGYPTTPKKKLIEATVIVTHDKLMRYTVWHLLHFVLVLRCILFTI
jgi:hypothetical protein